MCTVSVLLDAHKNSESWLKASELMVTHLRRQGMDSSTVSTLRLLLLAATNLNDFF